MTQISRRPLSDKHYKELFNNFSWVLSQINREQEMRVFLEDFLTPTEKIMLGKRFMIAILLLKGWNWSDICAYLHVSSTTVMNMKSWLLIRGEGFRSALNKLEKREKWNNFLKGLGGVIDYIPRSKSDIKRRNKLLYGR